MKNDVQLLKVLDEREKLPYSFYLAHSALSIFKMTLKMLGSITSQLAHPENESYFPRTAVMVVSTF